MKSPQSTKASPPEYRFTVAASFRASSTWFAPWPIRPSPSQNPRAKGEGRLKCVLKRWRRRPFGVVTARWAQMRDCLAPGMRMGW